MTGRRRFGPAWWTTVDVVRSSWRTRNLTGLLVLVAIVVAMAVAIVVKLILPFAVYPAL